MFKLSFLRILSLCISSIIAIFLLELHDEYVKIFIFLNIHAYQSFSYGLSAANLDIREDKRYLVNSFIIYYVIHSCVVLILNAEIIYNLYTHWIFAAAFMIGYYVQLTRSSGESIRAAVIEELMLPSVNFVSIINFYFLENPHYYTLTFGLTISLMFILLFDKNLKSTFFQNDILNFSTFKRNIDMYLATFFLSNLKRIDVWYVGNTSPTLLAEFNLIKRCSILITFPSYLFWPDFISSFRAQKGRNMKRILQVEYIRKTTSIAVLTFLIFTMIVYCLLKLFPIDYDRTLIIIYLIVFCSAIIANCSGAILLVLETKYRSYYTYMALGLFTICLFCFVLFKDFQLIILMVFMFSVPLYNLIFQLLNDKYMRKLHE